MSKTGPNHKVSQARITRPFQESLYKFQDRRAPALVRRCLTQIVAWIVGCSHHASESKWLIKKGLQAQNMCCLFSSHYHRSSIPFLLNAQHPSLLMLAGAVLPQASHRLWTLQISLPASISLWYSTHANNRPFPLHNHQS